MNISPGVATAKVVKLWLRGNWKLSSSKLKIDHTNLSCNSRWHFSRIPQMISEVGSGNRHCVFPEIWQWRQKAVGFNVVLQNLLHVTWELINDKEIAKHASGVHNNDRPDARSRDYWKPRHISWMFLRSWWSWKFIYLKKIPNKCKLIPYRWRLQFLYVPHRKFSDALPVFRRWRRTSTETIWHRFHLLIKNIMKFIGK